jgi:hypothetical protein
VVKRVIFGEGTNKGPNPESEQEGKVCELYPNADSPTAELSGAPRNVAKGWDGTSQCSHERPVREIDAAVQSDSCQ